MRTASTLLLTICSWPLLLAQEADTSFANIQQEYLKSTDSQPLEGVNASWKALDMEDTIPETLYTGVSGENGIVQDSVPVCIDSTVGLAEQYKDAVKVGPVPGNELNIQLPQELAGKHQLNLYDISGRQVKTEAFTGAQEHVSLQDLARGSYIYELLRDGEQVLSGKTVKVDVPVQGMQSYQPKSLAKNGQQKDLGDCEATYRIHWNAPDGWVNDSLDVTVSNTEENFYEILVQPWDTAYASGNIITWDNTGNNAKFVQLTLNTESMEQIVIANSTNPEILESGNGSTYENLPVAVDTTGETASTNAIYSVSWPFTPRSVIDSTALDIEYLGWQAGETTLEFEPGNNSNKFITLQRVLPEEEHPVYAKRYIEGYIGKLKDGSPGSVNTPAEDAIVVIEHDEGIDTANVDMNGYWVSPQAYDHQEEIFIGAGYPGGEHDGVNYGTYTNIDYIVEGSNLQDIASGDTTKIYKMNLMPTTAWSGKINENVDMTMSQFKEMYQVPHYHNAMFDTVAYHVNTEGMTGVQIDRIHDVAEDMTNWTPLTYVEMNEPIENESPYTIENATSTSHGSNVLNGTDNITNIQQGNVTGTPIQGTSSFYLSAQVNVTGILTAVYKELGFQRNAAMDVASRQSVMNSPANLPTSLDVAIISQKHHFDKEMFNSTSTVNLPFDYNNQTQNVGPEYLSDSTNITPQ